MTVDRAVALAHCPAEGDCSPRCPHCMASAAEVEAASAWLANHPAEEGAWAVGTLASVMGALRHWTAGPAPVGTSAGRWQISEGAEAVVRDLDPEQADAITRRHNQQVSAALRLVNWYIGGE